MIWITTTYYPQLKPLLFQLKTDTTVKWEFFWGDEFTKDDIDDEKWHRGYPWGGLSIAEDEWADPANLKLKDGVLELYANRTNELKKFPDWMLDSNALRKYGKKLIDGKYPLKFTGSAIWSKTPVRYGYFECRCKMPAGKGLWPAFWLYGGNPNDEIDFMELKGERPNDIHVDVHCPERCDGGYPGVLGFPKNWGEWVRVTSSLNEGWNIISGIWTPEYVIFYLNGNAIAYFKGSFKNSMNVIANLAVAVDGGPFKPGPDEKTPFPSKMEVDYIRIWKTPEDSVFMKKIIPNFEFAETDLKYNDISKNNLPRFKKVKRYMRAKKLMKKELGFISFYPVSKSKYMLCYNLDKALPIKICISDSKGGIVKHFNHAETNTILNLEGIYGKNKIELSYLERKISFFVDLQ